MATTKEVISALKTLQDAELTLTAARDNLPSVEIDKAKTVLGTWFLGQFKANLVKGPEVFKEQVGKMEDVAKVSHHIGKLPACFRQYKSDCKRAIIKARDMNLVKEAKALKGIYQVKQFSLNHAGDGDSTAAMTRLQKEKTALLKGLKGSVRDVMDSKIASVIDAATGKLAEMASKLPQVSTKPRAAVSKVKVKVQATKKKTASKRTRKAA